MTDADFVKIQDLIVKMGQANKQENSGLVGDIQRLLKQKDSKLDEFVVKYQKHRESDIQYQEETKEWRRKTDETLEGMEPAIRAMNKTLSFASSGGWLARGLIMIGAALSVIYGGWLFIKDHLK